MLKQFAPPRNITSFAQHIDDTFATTSWHSFYFMLAITAALIAFIVFFRQRVGRKASYLTGRGRRAILATVAAALLVFVVIDLVLILSGNRDTREIFSNYPTGPNVVRIMVMPQQWAWNFKYAGRDGEFNTPDDIDTLNDLRVPVDTPILLQMKSKDVIHGFMVPNL
jgi:cytochrome c oxidase subunit 2